MMNEILRCGVFQDAGAKVACMRYLTTSSNNTTIGFCFLIGAVVLLGATIVWEISKYKMKEMEEMRRAR